MKEIKMSEVLLKSDRGVKNRIHKNFTRAVKRAQETIGMSNQDLAEATNISDKDLIQHEYTSHGAPHNSFLEDRDKERIIEHVAHVEYLCSDSGFSDYIKVLRSQNSVSGLFPWETLSRHFTYGRGSSVFDEWSNRQELPSSVPQRYRIIQTLQNELTGRLFPSL
jgi:hypothetical protein